MHLQSRLPCDSFYDSKGIAEGFQDRPLFQVNLNIAPHGLWAVLDLTKSISASLEGVQPKNFLNCSATATAALPRNVV